MKYISKGDWFDEGSECRLLDDYRPLMDAGLFLGIVNGELDEEVCDFDEFDAIET